MKLSDLIKVNLFNDDIAKFIFDVTSPEEIDNTQFANYLAISALEQNGVATHEFAISKLAIKILHAIEFADENFVGKWKINVKG